MQQFILSIVKHCLDAPQNYSNLSRSLDAASNSKHGFQKFTTF